MRLPRFLHQESKQGQALVGQLAGERLPVDQRLKTPEKFYLQLVHKFIIYRNSFSEPYYFCRFCTIKNDFSLNSAFEGCYDARL